MKDKIKNILNLSKIYIKENENIKIIDWKNKSFNKSSFIFWVYVILVLALAYLSTEMVNYCYKIGKIELFLNAFLLFLNFLIIIRTIMLSTNIYYFSKDIENILHLPIKPIEVLLAKLLCLLFLNYEIILLIGVIPLLIYGNYAGLLFIIELIPILIIFPIFWTLIISCIMMILMKTVKFFKNKDLMQIIITIVLIITTMVLINYSIKFIFNNTEQFENNQELILNNLNEKIIKINNYFLNINPSINILQNNRIIFNSLILLLLNIASFFLFIFLGKKLYLKNILKAKFYYKTKSQKIKLKGRKKNISYSYIKKETKQLIKNPVFLIQMVLPVIITTFTISVLIIALVPRARELIAQEEIKKQIGDLKFNVEAVCIILGAVQIIGLSNYCSITAFSREGKNAFVMKYLPISLYKQYIYKNIPQIAINTICSIIIFIIINIQIPEIKINYIILMFIISFLSFLINSFILSLIDLLMPKLKWDAEYEILKNNKNKLLQYVLIVLNILFLIFINKLFKNHNLDKSLYTLIIILLIIFIIFNYIINKYKNKLYKKIN